MPVIDIEAFIQDIKSRPALWWVKHPKRKNKHFVAQQWDMIQKNYPRFTVDELKKRWKNLKDTYRKELKRIPQLRPGVPADHLKSNWRYFEAISFLKEELVYITKETEDPDPEKHTEVPSQSPESPVSSLSENEDTNTSNSLKQASEIKSEFLKIEKKKMRLLEQEVARSNMYSKSDNYHFLMSLLPEMDKLPPMQKMRLRTKISQAVLDEVQAALYDEQTTFSEVQPIQHIHYEEAVIDQESIKTEAINMYD